MAEHKIQATVHAKINNYLDIPLEGARRFELIPLLFREPRPRSLACVEPPGDVHDKGYIIKFLSIL